LFYDRHGQLQLAYYLNSFQVALYSEGNPTAVRE